MMFLYWLILDPPIDIGITGLATLRIVTSRYKLDTNVPFSSTRVYRFCAGFHWCLLLLIVESRI